MFNYSVNENSNIRNDATSFVLKPKEKKNGYYEYCLYDEKHQKHYVLAHRLVAEAFLSNPNKYKVVNHIDGNKHNNSVMNLEWCSYKENAIHAWQNGLNSSKKVDRAVRQYDLNGNFLKEYKNCVEAVRATGIKHVHCAAVGKRKTAGGYTWKFINADIPVKSVGKKKAVIQYDLKNTKIKEYLSISEAARQTKINRKSINDCCNGKLKTAGNFIWRFLQEDIVQ